MRDKKNLAVAALAVLAAALGAVVVYDRLPEAARARLLGKAGSKAAVKVFDAALDVPGLRYVDLVFDRPLGKDKVGQVLEREPASIAPRVEGVWKWRDDFALRFEVQGTFAKATEYELELRPDRLLAPGETFDKPTVKFATDRFKVTRIDVRQEPAPETPGSVVLRGRIEFNYAVDPDSMVSKLRLIDPLAGEAAPVPVGVDIHYWSQAVDFRSDPVRKEKAERELKLVVLGDLRPADGNVALGADVAEAVKIGSSETLTLWDVRTIPGDPESTIRLRFSSPVDAEALRKALSVSPAAEFRLAAEDGDAALTGAFAPGEDYEIAVAAGLPGKDGSVLREKIARTVSMPDLPRGVAFQSAGQFLASSGSRTVAVETVNAPSLDLSIHRVYRNNLFMLFAQYGYEYRTEESYWDGVNHALGDPITKEPVRLRVEGPRNKKNVLRLALGDRLPKGDRGLYRVSLRASGEDQGQVRWLLLTDLGVVAKIAKDEAFAWVTSVKDLSPVPGAAVRLLSDQNQPLAEGVTDARGVFQAKGLAASENGRPFLMTVEKGEDFTFVLLDQMRIDVEGLDVAGSPASGAAYDAYLYGERDLYRPGEAARGIAVVRDRRLGTPPAMPLLLRHRDPTGALRESAKLDLGAGGYAAFEHAIPAYARTGRHTLELLAGDEPIGAWRFQVEEFVPDRIKVELAPTGEPPAAGAEVPYSVGCVYLFGPPCSGLPVETRVRLEAAPFAPKGFEGFLFGDAERRFEPREVLFEQGALGEDGKAAFTARIPERLDAPAALSALVSARVREAGGRGMNAQYRLPVHPVPYYLGLRRTAAEAYAEPGKPVSIAYVAVSPKGEETAAGALRAELHHVRWNTVLRRTRAGAWRYESTRDARLVDSKTLEAGAARGTLAFTPDDYGSYAVVLSDPATGAAARVSFYASGWGYAPWAVENPARAELDLDKEEYAAGEKAVLQVRSPFAGKLLVTVERDGVFETQVHDLPGNTAKIEIPLRAEMRPNAYVTATVVRGPGSLEPGAAARAFGAVPVSVARAAGWLAPEIRAPEEVRPGGPLTVEVTAAPGALVTVAAVDEGVLQLVAQKTPNPFERFYRRLALGTESFDTYSLLLPEVAAEGTAPKGGGEPGGGMENYVRTEGIRRVRPVSFWSGPLTADASGKAAATFEVPEFQGSLRVMAVASAGDRFGSAEKFTRVREPLVLLPTFPRFLSFGESATIPVSVRNDAGAEAAVKVSLKAEGPVRIEGEAEKTVQVPNAAARPVSFALRTEDREGPLSFALDAEGGGERTRATESLSVRADVFPIAKEKAGVLSEATTAFALEGAEGLRPEGVTRSIRVGTAPLIRLRGKLAYLLEYPFGCLEQTVSAAFPLLYVADLARELEPELFEKQDPAARVQAGIRRILSMQLSGGGFAMWPGGDDPASWVGVYATHFLAEAARAGYAVPSEALKRALASLAEDARGRGGYEPGELPRVVYALYVLARAGAPEFGAMDVVRSKHKDALRPQQRALLAAAYAATGDASALDKLAKGIEDVEEVKRETGRFFASTVRDRALLLLGILDAAPEDPRVPKLAERLAREAELGFWTTHESAFALLALGQLAKRQAALPPIEGKVYLGNDLLGDLGPRTAAFSKLRGDAPIRVEVAKGFGAGPIYYSILTRGVPADAAFKPERAGLEIERVLLDRNGNPAKLDAVAQGDLLVVRTRVRSVSGKVDNVAVVNLLPSGIEVENPRLEGSEALPWLSGASGADHLDLRDDRILLFTDLPDAAWRTYYALARAVTPGMFRLPPAHAEAMYDPALRATGERGTITVLAPK